MIQNTDQLHTPERATRELIWTKKWSPIFQRIQGCNIQKITATDDGILVLGVYKPGDDRSHVQLSIAKSGAGVSLFHARPAASKTPNNFVQMARKYLIGSKIVTISGSSHPVAVFIDCVGADQVCYSIVLDLEAGPPRLCLSLRHSGVPERYAHVQDGYFADSIFWESLCEWTLQSVKTKRRACFERNVVCWCTLPMVQAETTLDATSTLQGTQPAPVFNFVPEIAHTEKPVANVTGVALFPPHVRRALKTKIAFLERRLLRQRQDLPSESEILRLKKRADGLKQFLYLWTLPAWCPPPEAIENFGLPASLQLKSGQTPGDVLNEYYFQIDKLIRRQSELAMRVGENAFGLEKFRDFVSLCEQCLAVAKESVGNGNEKNWQLLVQIKLPEEVKQLLAQLEISWTEGAQKRHEEELKKLRRLPYRSFKATTGEFIRVAKSATDGDQLVKLMPAHHFWIHVLSGEGSHVWLEKPKGGKPSPGAIRQAAMLAVHFSKHSRSQAADVYVTPRANVEKKKDLAPGKVIVRRSETLFVKFDDVELNPLLESSNL